MYETLQSIVDQLEFCEYQTKDGLHDLKMNAAFIALKKRATESGAPNSTQQAKREICPTCTGSGGLLDAGPRTGERCTHCGGSGKLSVIG